MGAEGDELGLDLVGSFTSLMEVEEMDLRLFEAMKGNAEMVKDDSKKHPVRERDFGQLRIRI